MIQVVGGIEMNAHGISYLWTGLKKIVKSCWGYITDSFKAILKRILKMGESLLMFIGLKKRPHVECRIYFASKEEEEDYKRL